VTKCKCQCLLHRGNAHKSYYIAIQLLQLALSANQTVADVTGIIYRHFFSLFSLSRQQYDYHFGADFSF